MLIMSDTSESISYIPDPFPILSNRLPPSACLPPTTSLFLSVQQAPAAPQHEQEQRRLTSPRPHSLPRQAIGRRRGGQGDRPRPRGPCRHGAPQ
jgi:hypothetical protein